MVRATTRLAPELSPSTSGPASGFRNKVCIRSPPKDNAPPASMQVRAFVSLKSIMMSVQIGWIGVLPNKTLIVSETGIWTLPNEILIKNRKKSRRGKETYQYCFKFCFISDHKRPILLIFEGYCEICQHCQGNSKNFKSHPCQEDFVSYLCSPFWSHIGFKA